MDSEEEATTRTTRTAARTRRTFTPEAQRGRSAFPVCTSRCTRARADMGPFSPVCSGLSVENPDDPRRRGGISDMLKNILQQARE